VILLAATGMRRSELLALRWEDVDLDGRVLTTGSVVRLKGQGLVRQDTTKGGGQRVVPLPQFAVDALHRLKGGRQGPNTGGVIFPSSTGTSRDPDNFGKQWREVRADLGLPDVSSHSFRKTVATLNDDSGLSARVGADQLGHARPSMTQDVYMRRAGYTRKWLQRLTKRSVYSTNKRRVAVTNQAQMAAEVARGGIEPPTFRFSGGRSYRLSYLAGGQRMPRRAWRP
jgi:integrase